MNHSRKVLVAACCALALSCLTTLPVAHAEYGELPPSQTQPIPVPVGVNAAGKPITQRPTISKETLSGAARSSQSHYPESLSSPAFIPDNTATSSIPVPTSIGTYSLIGADGRTTVTSTTTHPSSAIVLITRKGEPLCTGWMISKDTLVTVGHCLYDFAEKEWVKDLAFHPGASGTSRPFGSATATSKWVDKSFIESGNDALDWGVVKLNKNLGTKTGWFGLKTQSASYDSTSVVVRGYPTIRNGTMLTMSGSVTQSKTNFLCYSIDTQGGQSGSPVYLPANAQVIGIHAYGTTEKSRGSSKCDAKYNMGVRITRPLYDILMGLK